MGASNLQRQQQQQQRPESPQQQQQQSQPTQMSQMPVHNVVSGPPQIARQSSGFDSWGAQLPSNNNNGVPSSMNQYDSHQPNNAQQSWGAPVQVTNNTRSSSGSLGNLGSGLGSGLGSSGLGSSMPGIGGLGS